MTRTIRITEGPNQGRYEIDADGKIKRVQRANHAGEMVDVRTTVGRGTSRHKAVMAAAEACTS